MTTENELPLRATFVRTTFGDRDQARAALAQEDEDFQNQTVRFAVRRNCVLTTIHGTRLPGLSEVELCHVGPYTEMNRLVREGGVWALDADTAQARSSYSPERNRYRIGPRAIIAKAGRILSPGEWCNSSDFPGQKGQPAQPAVAAHVDRFGRGVAAVDARAEVPEISPEEQLQQLVSRGRVVDTFAENQAKMALTA